MATKNAPSPEVLRALLRYEPETGFLFWLPRGPEYFNGSAPHAAMWNVKFAGKRALAYKSKRGYLVGSMKPFQLKAHRVAWAIVHGDWPSDQIDHINGDRTDNRIANLRHVTNAENSRNSARRMGANKSGVTGVFFSEATKKWCAQITVNGKTQHLGVFDDINDAAACRKAAEVKNGFHDNHGRAA